MAVTYAVEGTEHAYGAPGAVTVTVVYDDRELPADMSFHDANGGLVRRIVFSRDTEGHPLTEVVHFGGETPFPGSPAEAGNILPEERAKLAAVMKTAFADQVFAHTTYAYDQKGRLLERTMRMGALSEERTTFQYDEHDNPIAETSERRAREMHIDDDGVALTREEEPRVQEQRFDYQYDDRGNWTERVVRGGAGSPPTFESSNIERRTITYHEL
jgi:hypothetical protein